MPLVLVKAPPSSGAGKRAVTAVGKHREQPFPFGAAVGPTAARDGIWGFM